MAETMSEVLAEHSVAGMSGGTHLACRCNRTWVPSVEYRTHLEAALSAAGVGLVADALNLRQIADLIMLKVVYAGNEGWTLTSEDRDDHEYVHCLNAAQAIIEQARAVS